MSIEEYVRAGRSAFFSDMKTREPCDAESAFYSLAHSFVGDSQ